ncbi:MAG TPA: hypothetical protein VFH43_10080 [Candidatus Kapabacteria bacterium]|nr:hypothetical protein [Candidatus Kapabacteria bacterium]
MWYELDSLGYITGGRYTNGKGVTLRTARRAFKDHALNLIQNFEALKQYTIRRIVEDNNLLSPSVN